MHQSQLPQGQPRARHLAQHRRVSHVRVTTHSRPRRAWEFLVRFHVRATTRSHLVREWAAQAVLVRQALVVLAPQVVQALQVALAVRPVQVVQVAQVASLAQPELRELDLLAQPVVQVPRAPQVLLAQEAVQLVVRVAVAEVTPAVPPVLSVRVGLAVQARLVSQSVQSAKSLSSGTTPQAWVVQ